MIAQLPDAYAQLGTGVYKLKGLNLPEVLSLCSTQCVMGHVDLIAPSVLAPCQYSHKMIISIEALRTHSK